MDEHDELAGRFERERPRLRAVAYRMLGSVAEADDAVQEAWLRLSRTDAATIDRLPAWLTTVVSRVCLNLLESRRTRREERWEGWVEPVAEADPERDALLADSVGPALLVVLDTLAPAERLAFVLHDVFAMPFEEVGPIVGRSTAAARQLASRARRRVRGLPPEPSAADRVRQRTVVEAFLAASRGGDFAGLLALLDPDVVARADATAVRMGSTAEVRGAGDVAETFAGRARAARATLVDGVAGLVWSRGGVPQVVFDFTVVEGRVVAIDLLADPDLLASFAYEILER